MCSPIYCDTVPEKNRLALTARLFGVRFVMLESFVFDTAGSLCEAYNGGFWDFHQLCNAGFYLSPASSSRFHVVCSNGFEGDLSADAFGITCSLYAYSHLSFSADADFGAVCSEHFHKLREFMLDHPEAASILRAID